jgi:hypothetical protein
VPIAVTVGFGTAFGQTLANGGSFGQAFAAGTMGGVTAGIGAYGMGVVGAYVASFGNPLLSYALAAVAIAGGTYQTVESFRSGQYVAGAVGAVLVAFAVASVLASAYGQGEPRLTTAPKWVGRQRKRDSRDRWNRFRKGKATIGFLPPKSNMGGRRLSMSSERQGNVGMQNTRTTRSE